MDLNENNAKIEIKPNKFKMALLIAAVSFVVWKKCCAQAPQSATIHLTTAPAVPLQQLPQATSQPRQQPQAQQFPQQPPPAYSHQNPTFNFKQPTAPVLIYT